MHIPAFGYTSHSYEEYFHKWYLYVFVIVRSLEKICWWEKSLPTKQAVWQKKTNFGISSKLLLKNSVSFLQTSEKWASLLTEECQILSTVLRTENSSEHGFLTSVMFREFNDGSRLVLALLPYVSRNSLHTAIFLCTALWNWMLKWHSLLILRFSFFYKRHCSWTYRKLQWQLSRVWGVHLIWYSFTQMYSCLSVRLP